MTTNRFLIGKFMQGLIPTEASMPTTSSCSFCKTTGAVADSEGTLMVCPVCQGRKEPWSQLQMKFKKMKIIRVDTVTDANGGQCGLSQAMEPSIAVGYSRLRRKPKPPPTQPPKRIPKASRGSTTHYARSPENWQLHRNITP